MVYYQGKRVHVCYYNGQKVVVRVDKSKGKPVLTLIPLKKQDENSKV